MFKYSNQQPIISSIKTMNNLASSLRKRTTPTEQFLWKYLRKRRLDGYKFRRQFAIDRYIVDFVCCEKKLIIEVDGPIHEQRLIHDQLRDAFLLSCGYKTLRFSNQEIMNNVLGVLKVVAFSLEGEGGTTKS